MYYVIYLHEGIHVAIHVLCNISAWRLGGGRARWTQSSYGQPTASHECEQYQPPENQKNLNLVKWVTCHVLHSCSDLWFFCFFFVSSMVLHYYGAAPLVFLVFLVFSMVFTSLAFAALCRDAIAYIIYYVLYIIC